MAKKKTKKFPFEIQNLGEKANNNFGVLGDYFEEKTKTKIVIRCLEIMPKILKEHDEFYSSLLESNKRVVLIEHLVNRIKENKSELIELEKSLYKLFP